MRSAYAWVLVGLVACTKAGPQQDSVEPPPAETKFAQPPEAKMPPPPAPAPTPPPSPPQTAAKVTIQMTSATLADDCGGGAPRPVTKAKAKSAAKADSDFHAGARAKRQCEQSSMQLSIKSDATGAATELAVKKVELFDDQGKLIGELTPRTPSAWHKDGTYAAWDQKIAAGEELAVSYALSQPPWGTVTSRWNRTYVLKAVLTVGGSDKNVKFDVHIAAPTFLPPNVKT